jgi:putative redox protein
MFISLSWRGRLAFEAETESGHHLLVDVKPEAGGEDQGPLPLEILLVSLGGCTGMDIASILTKKRVNLQGMTIKVNGERAGQHPKYFTKIDVEFNLRGKDIKEGDVKEAIELSRDKYCSVGAMLKEKAEITYRWNIVNKD